MAFINNRYTKIISNFLINSVTLVTIPSILILAWLILKLIAFIGITIIAQIITNIAYVLFGLALGALCLTIAYPFIRIGIEATMTLVSLPFRTMDNLLNRLKSQLTTFEKKLINSSFNQYTLGKIFITPFIWTLKITNNLYSLILCVPNEITKAFIKISNAIKLPSIVELILYTFDEICNSLEAVPGDAEKEKKDIIKFYDELSKVKTDKKLYFLEVFYNSFIDLQIFERKCVKYLKDSADKLISYKNAEAVAFANEDNKKINPFDDALNKFILKVEDVTNHVIDTSKSFLSILLMPFRSCMTYITYICIYYMLETWIETEQQDDDTPAVWRGRAINIPFFLLALSCLCLFLPIILVTGLDRAVGSRFYTDIDKKATVKSFKFTIRFFIFRELLDNGIIIATFNFIKIITSRALRTVITLLSLPLAIAYKMVGVFGLTFKVNNYAHWVNFKNPTLNAILFHTLLISQIIYYMPYYTTKYVISIYTNFVFFLSNSIYKLTLGISNLLNLNKATFDKYLGLKLGKIVYYPCFVITGAIKLTLNILAVLLEQMVNFSAYLDTKLRLPQLQTSTTFFPKDKTPFPLSLFDKQQEEINDIYTKETKISNQYKFKMAKIQNKLNTIINKTINIIQDLVNLVLYPLRTIVTFILLNFLLDRFAQSSLLIKISKLFAASMLIPIAIIIGTNNLDSNVKLKRLFNKSVEIFEHHEIVNDSRLQILFNDGCIVFLLELLKPLLEEICGIVLTIATWPLNIINNLIIRIRSYFISKDTIKMDKEILELEIMANELPSSNLSKPHTTDNDSGYASSGSKGPNSSGGTLIEKSFEV